MFMQFLIERARRVTHQRGYSPLILCGVSHLEFKYPNQLMHLTRQGSVLPLCRVLPPAVIPARYP
jgi:hypothetical protein